MPEEGVLELVLEGGKGFTEILRARQALWGPCWEMPRSKLPAVSPSPWVSSESLLSLSLLSSASISSLGRSEDTQLTHPAVPGSPFSLMSSPDLFSQTNFQYLLNAKHHG